MLKNSNLEDVWWLGWSFSFLCVKSAASQFAGHQVPVVLLRPPAVHHLTSYALAKRKAGDQRAALPLTCWCFEANLRNSHLEKEVTEPCLRDAGKVTWDNVHKMPSSGPGIYMVETERCRWRERFTTMVVTISNIYLSSRTLPQLSALAEHLKLELTGSMFISFLLSSPPASLLSIHVLTLDSSLLRIHLVTRSIFL